MIEVIRSPSKKEMPVMSREERRAGRFMTERAPGNKYLFRLSGKIAR